VPGGAALAIGITEPNPNFLWPEGERPVPPPFARWRDALAAIRPAYYRLFVDWAALQPDPAAPADLDAPVSGCLRDEPPCLGWAGLRDQLRALAARQREGGWEGVAVLTGTPAWAARPASGCEPDGPAEPGSRPPRPDALPAYRRLVLDVLAAAREEGASLRWWSPWNEPNHPYFLSLQRERCGVPVPGTASAPIYAELAAQLRAALDAAPGEQELVLGELAAATEAREDVTSVDEFIRALPRDLVCSVRVWAAHDYAGGEADVRGVTAGALAAHGCAEPHALWITETGVRRGPRALEDRLEIGAEATADAAAACGIVHAHLVELHADPQVTAAFQYTLREDDRFRTGLVRTDLTRAYPLLDLWRRWGGEGRPSADDPPPDPADACRGPTR